MNKIKNNYKSFVQKEMPKSEHLKNGIMAFLFGGAICAFGHGINMFGRYTLGLDEVNAASFQAIILVFLDATLTGFGIYDKIGKIAGAGTVVPITGFANSIVAPAMEFKREGIIMGTTAKMFIIAGPVLANGIGISVIIGIISLILG